MFFLKNLYNLKRLRSLRFLIILLYYFDAALLVTTPVQRHKTPGGIIFVILPFIWTCINCSLPKFKSRKMYKPTAEPLGPRWLPWEETNVTVVGWSGRCKEVLKQGNMYPLRGGSTVSWRRSPLVCAISPNNVTLTPAWEKQPTSRDVSTGFPKNYIPEPSAEISYWWFVTNWISVVLLNGWSKFCLPRSG